MKHLTITETTKTITHTKDIHDHHLYHHNGVMLFILNNHHHDKHTAYKFIDDTLVGWCNVIFFSTQPTLTGLVCCFVHPEFRNHGIGSSLVKQVFALVPPKSTIIHGHDLKFEQTKLPINLVDLNDASEQIREQLFNEVVV